MEPCTVLLVDDEVKFRDVLAKRLGHRGFTVRAAGSGPEALAIVSAEPIDIVLLDVKMEGMDGIEALRRIKAVAPDVEIIMLTGHANVEAAMAGIDSGAFDYLLKPVEFDNLLFRLQDALERRRLRKARGVP
jgi:DNA-binding NtrC family response regulator